MCHSHAQAHSSTRVHWRSVVEPVDCLSDPGVEVSSHCKPVLPALAAQHSAAVNCQVMTVDERGPIARQERRSICYIVGQT